MTDKFNRMNFRKKERPSDIDLLNEANRLFRYDDQSGNLIRIAHKNNRHPGQGRIGDAVGGDDGHGYRMCELLGHKFKVHQIVWLMNTGAFPNMSIDHIDHNRRNNKIDNLRLANDIQNMQNLRAAKSETAGLRKEPNGRGWSVYLGFNRAKKYLGCYKTIDEARQAYIKASRDYRGEYSPV